MIGTGGHLLISFVGRCSLASNRYSRLSLVIVSVFLVMVKYTKLSRSQCYFADLSVNGAKISGQRLRVNQAKCSGLMLGECYSTRIRYVR